MAASTSLRWRRFSPASSASAAVSVSPCFSRRFDEQLGHPLKPLAEIAEEPVGAGHDPARLRVGERLESIRIVLLKALKRRQLLADRGSDVLLLILQRPRLLGGHLLEPLAVLLLKA